jgi:hypothetical protein
LLQLKNHEDKMDPLNELEEDREPGQLEALAQVFCEELMACMDECARGRRGLFSGVELLNDELGERPELAWPEAERLRELALALQGIFAQ